MGKQVTGVQPSVLRWARESAGLTVEAVAQKLDRAASDIESWEGGTSAPTYPQLEKLAYEVYKRPLAVFFFPSPPAEMTAAMLSETVSELVRHELGPSTLQRFIAVTVHAAGSSPRLRSDDPVSGKSQP